MLGPLRSLLIHSLATVTSESIIKFQLIFASIAMPMKTTFVLFIMSLFHPSPSQLPFNGIFASNAYHIWIFVKKLTILINFAHRACIEFVQLVPIVDYWLFTYNALWILTLLDGLYNIRPIERFLSDSFHCLLAARARFLIVCNWPFFDALIAKPMIATVNACHRHLWHLLKAYATIRLFILLLNLLLAPLRLCDGLLLYSTNFLLLFVFVWFRRFFWKRSYFNFILAHFIFLIFEI